MQYALLIYDNYSDVAKTSPAEAQKMTQSYMEFAQWLQQSGKARGGEPLANSAQSIAVRVRDGKVTTIDGPFAETKEQLGGFFIVEPTDREDAISIAARIPGARTGCVVVRPILKRGA